MESDILRNVSYDENRFPTFPTTFFKVWPSGTTYRSRRKRIHCHTCFNTRPLVIDVFKYDGSVYIIQEFIDAPMLLTVWRKLGLDDRKRCMIQLKGYLEQLRSLVPPEPGKVQSMTGKVSLTSDLVTMTPRGPFESHDGMHEFFHPQPPQPAGGNQAKILWYTFSKANDAFSSCNTGIG